MKKLISMIMIFALSSMVFAAATFVFLSFLVRAPWKSIMAGKAQARKIEYERELVKSLYASCMGGSGQDVMFARFYTHMFKVVAKK